MRLSKLNSKIISQFSRIILFPKNFQYSAFQASPCKDDLKSCNIRQRITTTVPSKCEKIKEAHGKCQKISPTPSSREKTIPNESPVIPKPENPSDVYLRAHKAIKSKAVELTNFLNTSKNMILKDIEKRMNAARLQDIEDIRKILCTIDKRIKILIELDLKCAYKNKMKVYKLNDRANQSMKACDNSADLAVKKLEMEIEQLIDKTCNKVDLVMETINSCKQSKSPERLGECIKSKGAEAVQLLDEISSAAKKQINQLEKSKDESINERKIVSKQISKEYQKAMHDLSEQLSQYIKRLENKKSLFKKIFKID